MGGQSRASAKRLIAHLSGPSLSLRHHIHQPPRHDDDLANRPIFNGRLYLLVLQRCLSHLILRDVGRRLDALIMHTLPGVQKAVKWNSPFYGIEGQGWFLSYHCFARYVKVAFFRGASLRPRPPGESRHKEVRYLDIHENEQLDERQLADWVKQASQLPGERM